MSTLSHFRYSAVTLQGLRLTGTIEAADESAARHQLQMMQLQVSHLVPAEAAAPVASITGDDFIAFNQQLAHLTAAGMPVEQGLRLIAQDLRRGKLKNTVLAVARELENGTPLPQALEKYQRQFPALYGQLVNAGIQSNNLPAMLLNIGRHAEMVQRLRQVIWKSLAYPLAMAVGFTLVASFIGWMVLPQMRDLLLSFNRSFGLNPRRRSMGFQFELPLISEVFLQFAQMLPWIALGIAIVAMLILIVSPLLRGTRAGIWLLDSVVLRLPLVGPPVRWNLLARWCDAARVAVDAGLDLPRAINLASDAVASPKLKRDGEDLIAAINAAQPTQALGNLRLLPATVPATLDHGTRRGELPTALATLATLYQQQAEVRLNSVGTLLTPLLMLPVALLIGGAILAVMAPILSLIRAISSPW